MNLILSYPRSGSTFVRYIIEHFTQRPTRGPPTSTNLIDTPVLAANKNNTKKTIAFKIHGQDALHQKLIQGFLTRKIPLMFLMRNPIEMLTRHTDIAHTRAIINYPQEPIPDNIAYFFENMKTYESYEEKKQIFYYEDLVENPKDVIEQLCKFLNVDSNGIEQQKFMDNFEEHFEKSRDVYNKHQSDAQDLVFCLCIDPLPVRDKTFIRYSQFLAWAKVQYDDGVHPGWEWLPTTGLEIFNFNDLHVYSDPINSPPRLEVPWAYELSIAAPADEGIHVMHGEELLGRDIAISIPTSIAALGTHSDGKTILKYTDEFSEEELSRFWHNFKTLCGEGNWYPCERYCEDIIDTEQDL